MNEVTTAPTHPPVIKVAHLSTTFDGALGEWRAVDDVSFALERGESLGVVGESGSGKSLLVRSLMSLQPPQARTTGDISIDGRPLAGMKSSERRKLWGPVVSMVFQDPMTSLNPVRRIRQHLVDPLRYHLGLSGAAARKRALELLDLVKIPDASRRLEQYPHELSGGMRQRISIALAIACDPLLLIADEPTTALDVTVQSQVLDLLQGIQAELGMAMILISHDLEVVTTRTDRAAVMYGGHFVEMGDSSAIFGHPRHQYTAALLQARPRVTDPAHTELNTIPGSPPRLAEGPLGCRFAPRCQARQSDCEVGPVDLVVRSGHAHRCLHPVHEFQSSDSRDVPINSERRRP